MGTNKVLKGEWATSSTTTSGDAPAPTRTGTVQECQKWYVAKSGDSCGDVATNNGITIAQFVAWNTDVNRTRKNPLIMNDNAE